MGSHQGQGGPGSLISSPSLGSKSPQIPGQDGEQGDGTPGRRVGPSTLLGQFHHPDNSPGRLLMLCLPDPGSQTGSEGGHFCLDEPVSPSACPRGLLRVPTPLGTALSWQKQRQSSLLHLGDIWSPLASRFPPPAEPRGLGCPPTMRCFKLTSPANPQEPSSSAWEEKWDDGSSRDLRPHLPGTSTLSYCLQ